jgi:hypothetical protein
MNLDESKSTKQKVAMKIGKFVIVILFIIILVVICRIAFFQILRNIMCGEEVLQEIYSPDHAYKVVVFEYDCGSTTGFGTGVSIIKASERWSSNYFTWGGNIFSLDGHPDWTINNVYWKTNRSVKINYMDEFDIYFKKTKIWIMFTTIKIDYQLIPSNFVE